MGFKEKFTVFFKLIPGETLHELYTQFLPINQSTGKLKPQDMFITKRRAIIRLCFIQQLC